MKPRACYFASINHMGKNILSTGNVGYVCGTENCTSSIISAKPFGSSGGYTLLKTTKFMPDFFLARSHYVGEKCWLCENVIQKEERIKYYGGPFVFHYDCLLTILEDHR